MDWHKGVCKVDDAMVKATPSNQKSLLSEFQQPRISHLSFRIFILIHLHPHLYFISDFIPPKKTISYSNLKPISVGFDPSIPCFFHSPSRRWAWSAPPVATIPTTTARPTTWASKGAGFSADFSEIFDGWRNLSVKGSSMFIWFRAQIFISKNGIIYIISP